MTREDIIRMAREAGLSITPARSGEYHGGMVGGDAISLSRFASLAVAAEQDVHGMECQHCYAAHLAIQERKAMRKSLGAVKAAMTKGGAA